MDRLVLRPAETGTGGVFVDGASRDRPWRRLRATGTALAGLLLGLAPLAALALPPVAVPDTFGVLEGGSFSDNVLTNDSDPEGDDFIAEIVSEPARHVGAFTLNPDGSFNYQHDGSEFAQDSFSYTAFDPVNDERSPPVAVTINVTAQNDQPDIVGQAPLSTPEETGLTLTASDLTIVDPDGPGATLIVGTGPNYNVSGTTITPVADFNGNLTVPVIVDDGSGEPNAQSNPFNVTVTVTAVNDRPQITGQDPLSTPEETPLTLTVGDLTIVDPDGPGASLIVGTGSNYSVSGTTITPDDNFNGNLTVPVVVNDGSGAPNALSDPFNLLVTVGASNDQPVITGQDPLDTDEETPLILTPGDLDIDDPDGPGATLIVGAGPNYTVSGTTITPVDDFNGTLTVPVVVDDGSGEPNARSDPFNVSVDVNPVNDQPAITGQVPLSTQEETPLTLVVGNLTIVDPDSSSFTLDVGTGPNYTVSGTTITPEDDFNGTLTVPVTVDDGSGAGNSRSDAFNVSVTVGGTNDQPVITGQRTLATDEETPLPLTLADISIDDPDGPGATLFVAPGPNYSVAGTTITPALDFNGALTVPVTVDDGSGEANSQSPVFNLAVTVNPVNDRPVITAQVPLSTPEETPLTLVVGNLTIVDPDGPGAALEVRAGPNYTVSGTTVTPDDEFNGALSVPVVVDDQSGAPNALSAVFNVSITVTAENDPPEVVAPIGDRTAIEDQPFSLDVSSNFSDADGDPLSFTADGLPDSGNFVLSPAGVLSGTADDADVGTWDVGVTARDPSGATVTNRFQLTVLNVNDQPVITGQVPLSTLEETPLTLTVANLTIDDPDSSSFTLAVFPGDSYTVSGTTITPALDFNGVLIVPVTVDDGSGAGNSESPVFNLRVTVTPANDQPIITGQQPVAIDEDTSRTIVPADLIVVDPDNNFPADFTVLVGDGPNYSRTGTTITPERDFNGTLTVPVRVNDGSGEPNALSAVFNLSVVVNPVNDAPVVSTPIADQDTLEDQPFGLDVTGNFRDVENDPLTFTATGQPGSIVLSSDGRFSGTPTNDDVGVYTVRVTATDPSQTSAVDQFRLTVINVNDRPVIVGQGTLITPEETALEIMLDNLVVTDPDNDFPDDFALFVRNGANYTRRNNTITPDEEFAGVLSVPVAVDDGTGTSNSLSEEFILAVTVTSQNDVPVITGQQPAPIIIDEDEPLTIGLNNLLVTDPDDVYPDDFTLNIEPGTNYTVTAADTITPAQDFNGLLVVNVTVSDPEATSPQFGLIVDIQPVNDAPVITGQLPLSTEEETPITVTVTDLVVEDPDIPAQTLTLTLGAGENYTLEGNTVTPAENFFGALTVPAIVSDGVADSEPFDLLISVGAVNDLPVITGQLPLSTPEDTPLTITLGDLTVDDPDSEYPADFTLTVLPGENYVVADTTITPAADFFGELSVPVTVNDGTADSAPFPLVVSVLPVNDRPVITGQVQLRTPEDTPLLVTLADLTVSDPDNEYPADFTLTLAPGENYTVAGTTVTPLSNFNGRLDVAATVNDGIEDSAPFNLRITVTEANDAPILIAPLEDQQAVEDEFFSVNLGQNFDDADGDDLTFSIEGLPDTDNLTLDPDTGVLSGTPDFNDTRDFPYDVTVTAADPSGGTGSGSFQLTIAALDRANVALTVAATPAPALLGDQIRWTLTVANAGPGPSVNLGVIGEITGSNLGVTPGAGSDCQVEPGAGDTTTFDCSIANIAAGAQAVIVFNVTTDEPGDIMLAAEASGRQRLPIDPNVSDNADQTTMSVARSLSNGAVQTLGSASVFSIAAGDVDGDGDPDLILGTGAGQAAEIYRGTGSRTFEEVPILIADNAPNEGVAVADLDGDDDVDLVFANGSGLADTVYLNDGSGGFLPAAALGALDSRDVVIEDLNGDGRLDLAFAAIGRNPVYVNDGAGGYLLVSELGNLASLGVASADFNGDGWQDLVFANTGAPSRIYLNDGGAGFLSPQGFNIGNATAVAVLRADGNGTPDLVFARVPDELGDMPSNPVFTNDGAANFTQIEVLGGAPTLDIAIGDINADGREDLIFVNATGTHQVWRNTPSGFRLNAEQIVDLNAVAAVSGDLGNDGGNDLALAVGPQGGGDLFLNDSFGKLGLGDAVAPVLELRGQASVSIEAGTPYVDAGATATDNIEGDISSRVETENPVNNSVVGTYEVVYRVSDFAGNQAEPISRSVRVVPAAGTGGGGGGSIGPLGWLLLLVALGAGRGNRRTGKLVVRSGARRGP